MYFYLNLDEIHLTLNQIYLIFFLYLPKTVGEYIKLFTMTTDNKENVFSLNNNNKIKNT